MDVSNPYAPPQAPLHETAGPGTAGGGWRLVADTLIVEKGAKLPPICVFNGEPTEGQRVNRKLGWAPPAVIMLVALAPLLGLILVLALRKTGRIDYALSQAARQRRKSAVLIILGGIAAFVALIALTVAMESAPLALAGLVVFFVTLVVGLVRLQPFRIVKIDKTRIHLKLRPEATRAFARLA